MPIPRIPVEAPALTAEVEGNRIVLNWSVVEGAKYRLYRSELINGNWSKDETLISSTEGLAWGDTTIKPGTQYKYRMKANVGGFWSDYSEEVVVTTAEQGITVEAPVLKVEVKVGLHSLSWTTVAGAKYRVYRSELLEDGTWSRYAPLVLSTSLTTRMDTEIMPGKQYKYRVRANVEDIWSGYSNTKKVVALEVLPPDPPTVEVTASSGKNVVSWTTVPDATQYRVYRRDNESGSWSDWVMVARVAKVTSWSDTDVTTGKQYKYRVRAYTGVNWGDAVWTEYSNAVSVRAK